MNIDEKLKKIARGIKPLRTVSLKRVIARRLEAEGVRVSGRQAIDLIDKIIALSHEPAIRKEIIKKELSPDEKHPFKKAFSIAKRSGLKSSEAEKLAKYVARDFLEARNKLLELQREEKRQAQLSLKAKQKQARLDRKLAYERRKSLLRFIIEEVSEVNNAARKRSIAIFIALRNGMSQEEASNIAKKLFGDVQNKPEYNSTLKPRPKRPILVLPSHSVSPKGDETASTAVKSTSEIQEKLSAPSSVPSAQEASPQRGSSPINKVKELIQQVRTRRRNYSRAFNDYTPTQVDFISGRWRGSSVSRYARYNPARFREMVLQAYGFSCAISSCSIEVLLEAAHIEPYKNPLSDSINNGICLRTDLHTLFDSGFLHITSEYVIKVDKTIQDDEYRRFHDKRLRLPWREEYWPSKRFLNSKCREAHVQETHGPVAESTP